jgi:hypothetical protein
MINQANVKLYAYKSRHSINLPSDFVRDSAFPFDVGEELTAKIEDGKLVIGKKVKLRRRTPQQAAGYSLK